MASEQHVRTASHRSVLQLHPGSQQCPFAAALRMEPGEHLRNTGSGVTVIRPCQGILLSLIQPVLHGYSWPQRLFLFGWFVLHPFILTLSPAKLI